jgi:TatD DNase family protein
MKMPFDIHTHNPQIGNSGIYNLSVSSKKKILTPPTYFSAGIHPWDVGESNSEKTIHLLEQQLSKKNCLAVGEIGLDKNFGTNLVLQKEILNQQLKLALKYNKKVLIIHCVKAFQEIVAFKNENPSNIIWIIHGFNGSGALIESLSKQGFYFSIGHLILNNKTHIARNIKLVPVDKLLLETDDKGLSIIDIYLEVAKKLNISYDELKNQIANNLNGIFPDLEFNN